MAKASTKKRKVIIESSGEAHINATFNNIIISLTNKKGEVISWSSAGKMGFRKRILLMPLKWQLKIAVKLH
jgi:small subunit ribosomal protein S11